MTRDSSNELSGSAAFNELMRFCNEHNSATKMLNYAAEDYAAARCLLINQLFGGLIFGAQVIEKLLKSYILLDDPKRNVRKDFNYGFRELLKTTSGLYPGLSFNRYESTIQKFSAHYATRYPDSKGQSDSKTTADLFELDELVMFLNENLPCPRNVKFRTGLYAKITFSLGYNATVTPWEFWIKRDNFALVPKLEDIRREYFEVINQIHPNIA